MFLTKPIENHILHENKNIESFQTIEHIKKGKQRSLSPLQRFILTYVDENDFDAELSS